MKNTALTQFRDTGTLYLSAPEAAELVRRLGLPHCLQHMAQHIRADFLRWADFDKTARVAAHSKDGVIELMPVADDHRYSFKYVNGHPGNTRFGMSTVMAFGVLADVDTGAPLFLSELTLTTALRTAAMSALAAQTLARRDSRVMALIGNGAQSEFQALAFQHLVGITSLRVYDVDPAASAKLVANLLAKSGVDRVLAMDLHSAQIQGYFDIPVDHLESSSIFIPYIESLKLENLTFAAPDVGSANRIREIASYFNAEMVICDKHRKRANEIASMVVIGEVAVIE